MSPSLDTGKKNLYSMHVSFSPFLCSWLQPSRCIRLQGVIISFLIAYLIENRTVQHCQHFVLFWLVFLFLLGVIRWNLLREIS